MAVRSTDFRTTEMDGKTIFSFSHLTQSRPFILRFLCPRFSLRSILETMSIRNRVGIGWESRKLALKQQHLCFDWHVISYWIKKRWGDRETFCHTWLLFSSLLVWKFEIHSNICDSASILGTGILPKKRYESHSLKTFVVLHEWEHS